MAITVCWQAAIIGDRGAVCAFFAMHSPQLWSGTEEDFDFIHALTWQAKL